MKAIFFDRYGAPEKLRLIDLPKPEPQAGEMLVKVKASAINDWDWSLVRGKPWVYRLLFGLFGPKYRIPGIEFSGTVEKLGQGDFKFKVGDEIYGDISDQKWGTWAEYICIKEGSVIKKPQGISHENAAALSHASMLAYQGLVESGKISNGQRILINGAGGGMGTFALQIAREYDVEVTGVDSGRKLEMMRSMGFDHIVDYKKEDFTRSGKQYDLILDAKTTRSPKAHDSALTKEGIYVTVGGDLLRMIQILLARILGRKNMLIVALKSNKDLDYIHELYARGRIKPVIDGPYDLDEASRLLRYFGDGKHSGKIVLNIGE